ncbi:MAG: YMGG-like glycine zipper-containing protein [Betaproteobacteria bacterium]
MNTIPVSRRLLVLPLTLALLASGCATLPSGPNVMVMPGAQKNYAQFQNDQAACQQNAQAAIGGESASQAAANTAVASALIGTALGAAVGAIIGSASGMSSQGAAWGAGTGLLYGSAAGANASGYTYAEAQRRYDMAYVQCMYARGNAVPGQMVPRGVAQANASAYPPPNTPPPVMPGYSTPQQPRIAAPRMAPPSGPIAPYSAPTSPSDYPPPNTPPPPGYGSPPMSGDAPSPESPASRYPPPNTPPPPGLGPARG